MQADSLADVQLIGRALSGGWLDETEEKKKQAIESLFSVIANNDNPAMKVKAFEALVRADLADIKRKELELRKQELDEANRLRLLAILQHLPAEELGRLTSGDTGSCEE